jgi:hypothetical protein
VTDDKQDTQVHDTTCFISDNDSTSDPGYKKARNFQPFDMYPSRVSYTHIFLCISMVTLCISMVTLCISKQILCIAAGDI